MSLRLRGLNPYQLHKTLINQYLLKKPGDTKLLQRDTSKDKTDFDVIRENHKFLWDDDEVQSWEQKLAKKYFDKLFKEYTISDLSRFKENKIALRWRTETEVVAGKGQFICGNKVCSDKDALRTWEVNFAYVEQGQKKNTLVKLRLCPTCSEMLNYRTKKREIKRLKKNKKRSKSETTPRSSATSAEPSTSESPQSSREQSVAVEASDIPGQSLEQNCWTKGPEVEDRSREDEFDEYLEDLLL